MLADRYTDRHTDLLITILYSSTRSRVNRSLHSSVVCTYTLLSVHDNVSSVRASLERLCSSLSWAETGA